MSEYRKPEDYQLYDTLEVTLNNHRFLQEADRTLRHLRTIRDNLLGSKDRIERVYAHHVKPLDTTEVDEWIRKLAHAREDTIVKVSKRFVEQKIL